MTAINGKACVVNGKAVDAVFSNGKQVYGRNLLKGTAKIEFRLNSNGGTQTVQKYDDETNYIQHTSNTPINRMGLWTSWTPEVGQIYTLSADVCGNGYIQGEFHYEGGDNGSLGRVDLTDDWQRISNTFRVNTVSGNWTIYANNSTLLKVKHIKIDKGSSNGKQVYGRNYFSVSDFTANKYSSTLYYFYHLQLLPNTKYTVSTNNVGITNKGYANIFVGNKGFTPSTLANGVIVNKPKTVTTDNTGVLAIAARNYSLADGKDKIQVELGTVETPWTPAPEDVM